MGMTIGPNLLGKEKNRKKKKIRKRKRKAAQPNWA